MKESKKVIVSILKKSKERGDKFENQVLALAIKQMEGARDDGWGVFYSKNGKRLVMSKKTIEGSYAVKDDTQEIGDHLLMRLIRLSLLRMQRWRWTTMPTMVRWRR